MKRNKKSKNKKKNSLDITKLIAIIGGILAIFQILDIVNDLFPKGYSNEYTSEWLNMEEAEVVLSNTSELTVYKQKATIQDYYAGAFALTGSPQLVERSNSTFDDVFYGGAVMVALYHNLDDNERTITKFTVTAKNVVEDISPQLVYNLDSYPSALCEIQNLGWEETGAINVRFYKMYPWKSDHSHGNSIDVALKANSKTSWNYESILPGQARKVNFLSEFFLNIDWTNLPPLDDFYLQFCVEAENSNYSDIIEFGVKFSVTLNRHYIFHGFPELGDGEITGYGIEIDTDSAQWSETFHVNQSLPPKQTIRIPILIYPKKSCNMSIQITFETLDGDIIKSQLLKNASFVVPYYDDVNYLRHSFETYIDGLEWDSEEDGWIYFPYTTSSEIVTP